jgi:Protein-tyrosine-phosphatase
MKIAFICTGNSARSQMAEGFAKYFAKIYNKNIEIYSAGSNPTGYVHPFAIKVMKEISIDISNQYSKSLNEIPYKELNLVITVCGDAKEHMSSNSRN